MTDFQLNTIINVWRALGTLPGDTSFSSARDSLLEVIADFFSVKPAPLAAWLRTPFHFLLPEVTQSKGAVRICVQQWVDDYSSAKEDISTRVFVIDLVEHTQCSFHAGKDVVASSSLKRAPAHTDAEWLLAIIHHVKELAFHEVWVSDAKIGNLALPLVLPE